MSLISTVLALVVIPLKARAPRKTEREKKLEADVELLTFALDYWRDAGRALMAENERLRTANERLHAQRNWQGLGQAAQLALDRFLNCVPSRAQVLGTHEGESNG